MLISEENPASKDLEPEADPPEDDELDGFDGVDVELHGDSWIFSKPSVGALSALTPADAVAFYRFYPLRDDLAAARTAMVDVLSTSGDAAEAESRASALSASFERDGWLRNELPQVDMGRLQSIYFTVTRRCDLACQYCYQGLENRTRTEMGVEQAARALDKIRGVNPNCIVIVTGGEPFAHPRIFEILDEIDKRGFRFTILSNGTYVDDAIAARLKAMKGFWYIQLSIDGISEETHSQTRGKGHLAKVMRAFESIKQHGLPFVLAPTVHNGNLHELYDIAALAIANGGWCKPNNLREFPHKGLRFDRVYLSNDQLLDALRGMNRRLIDRFGVAEMAKVGEGYKGAAVCSVDTPNAKFICGMGHSLMDLDWNGDVYPCHLTKDKALIIGNLFDQEWDELFDAVESRHLRVKSHEIPKCSGCKFVSTCGGGCRAGAWFAYGSLAREDNLCATNYESSLRRLLIGATSR